MLIIMLSIFATLLLTFGVTILAFALGNPDWYKKVWKDNIINNVPDNLVNVTVILGAVCTGLGFIFGLVALIKSEGESTRYRSVRRKKSKKKGIILIERKLKTGPSGGSYYVRRKCDRHGCKNIKIYTK